MLAIFITDGDRKGIAPSEEKDIPPRPRKKFVYRLVIFSYGILPIIYLSKYYDTIGVY
jgi:hypothetical protein